MHKTAKNKLYKKKLKNAPNILKKTGNNFIDVGKNSASIKLKLTALKYKEFPHKREPNPTNKSLKKNPKKY